MPCWMICSLRHRNQRSLDAEPATFNSRFRCKRRRSLECLDELGPAIGIAGVVERVHANEDVIGPEHFCPREGERQHDRIPRGYIGRRYRAGMRPVLGHLAIPEQRRAAERREINRQLAVRSRAKRLGNLARRENLMAVALAVIHRQCINLEPGVPRKRRLRYRNRARRSATRLPC